MLTVVYKATLLVCLSSTPVAECTREEAVSVVPLDVQRDLITPIDCLIEAQSAASRGRYILEGEYGRVECRAVREKDMRAPKPLGQ